MVIPFWDLDPRMLKDCIDSIQLQSERCDILVVDNCSRSPVLPIADARVVRLPERVSVGAARNAGLEQVRTPYVMFMDADDKLLPGAVAHLLRSMQAAPGAAMAAGRILDWNPESGQVAANPWPGRFAHWASERSAGFYRACNMVRNMTPVTGCAVLDTAMAKATGGFPDTTAEDWTFGVSMSFQGRVVLSAREVKLYRWRRNSLSRQAMGDLPMLLAARAATRVAIRAEAASPGWAKAMPWLFAVAHTLELPFHILRDLFPRARRWMPPSHDTSSVRNLVPRAGAGADRLSRGS